MRKFILLLVFFVCGAVCGCAGSTALETKAGGGNHYKYFDYLGSGDIVEYIDPKTQIHYLVVCGEYGNVAITPRYNSHGEIMHGK